MLKLKKIPVNEHGMDTVSPMMSAPSFYMNDKQIKEIADWEVGEKYQLIIEVEQKSKNETEQGTDARFEITSYKYVPPKDIKNMTDKEFGEYQSKALSKGHL